MDVPKKRMFKSLTEGMTGYIFYSIIGLIMAFLLNQTLGFALSTDLPVVAVVTSSMQHDETIQITHYQWLEENLGYDKEYIDSWPIPNGFSVGDMPIVQGLEEYKVGDVIVYTAPGQNVPIIHRIIKINDDGTYMVKGDRNSNLLPFENSIAKDQIHGKVIFIIPKLGYFKVFVSKITGGLI